MTLKLLIFDTSYLGVTCRESRTRELGEAKLRWQCSPVFPREALQAYRWMLYLIDKPITSRQASKNLALLIWKQGVVEEQRGSSGMPSWNYFIYIVNVGKYTFDFHILAWMVDRMCSSLSGTADFGSTPSLSRARSHSCRGFSHSGYSYLHN